MSDEWSLLLATRGERPADPPGQIGERCEYRAVDPAGASGLRLRDGWIDEVLRTRDQLSATMGWVEDFGAGTIKMIGTLEILAVVRCFPGSPGSLRF